MFTMIFLNLILLYQPYALLIVLARVVEEFHYVPGKYVFWPPSHRKTYGRNAKFRSLVAVKQNSVIGLYAVLVKYVLYIITVNIDHKYL